MRSGGNTTVIQRVLERRAQKPPTTDEGTTATVAVMVRVLPPPKALLAFEEPPLRESRNGASGRYPRFRVGGRRAEALRRLTAEFRPVVLTDSPELIRKLRAQHRRAHRTSSTLPSSMMPRSARPGCRRRG